MQTASKMNNIPNTLSAAFQQHLYTLAINRFQQPDTDLNLLSTIKCDKAYPFTSTMPYPTAILSQFSA